LDLESACDGDEATGPAKYIGRLAQLLKLRKETCEGLVWDVNFEPKTVDSIALIEET
jgi:hypothetical protein